MPWRPVNLPGGSTAPAVVQEKITYDLPERPPAPVDTGTAQGCLYREDFAPAPTDALSTGIIVRETPSAPAESGIHTATLRPIEVVPAAIDLGTLIQLETSPAARYPVTGTAPSETLAEKGWTLPGRITADDALYATCTSDATHKSSTYLNGQTFNWLEENGGPIPAGAEILRVTAEFEYAISVVNGLGAEPATVTMQIRSPNGNVRLSGTYVQASNTSSPQTLRTITTGGTAAAPQTTFTRAMLANSDFSAGLVVSLPILAPNTFTIEVDFVRTSVWWRKTYTA